MIDGNILSIGNVSGNNIIKIDIVSDDFLSTFSLSKYKVVNGNLSQVDGWFK